MPNPTLKERLAAVLDGLGYDFTRFNVWDFAHWLAARRGRPIHLMPMALPPELFGAWIKSQQADYIFYEAASPEVHVVHILLHELSHVLLDHQTLPLDDGLTLLLHYGHNRQAPAAFQQVEALFRNINYTDAQEHEAETLSALIQLRVFRLAGLGALTTPSANPEMRQIIGGLGLDR